MRGSSALQRACLPGVDWSSSVRTWRQDSPATLETSHASALASSVSWHRLAVLTLMLCSFHCSHAAATSVSCSAMVRLPGQWLSFP
eukprot:GHRR01028332.1.p1 GENE.GHRR01028332.1~~GHRR01028332.1.p1  ORF type:complete len:101 (+),score=23.16 GHRR01028332.1:47-304(+)